MSCRITSAVRGPQTLCYRYRMSRNHPNFTPASRPGHRPTTREASSFLQGDEVMAGLLPTLEKMAALQA